MKHKTHHFSQEEKIEETIGAYMTSPLQSVTGTTTILEVSQLMAEKNIGSVLVTKRERVYRHHHRTRLNSKSHRQGARP